MTAPEPPVLTRDRAAAGPDPSMRTAKEKGWIRKLWPWLARHKKDVFLAFGVAIVGMVIAALTPVVEKVLLDNITIHPHAAIWPWLLLLAPLASAQARPTRR